MVEIPGEMKRSSEELEELTSNLDVKNNNYSRSVLALLFTSMEEFESPDTEN